jgi:GntR family transcriptional regulator/MocR family aminotransferase
VDLHVSLVGRKDLTGQIYGQIRQAILDGHLRPGDRIPPSRELATRLDVSRTTVMVALDRLAGEGFLGSTVGAGTFVTGDVASNGSAAGPPAGVLRPRPGWETITLPTAHTRVAEFDFRCGRPDARRFPYDSWRRLVGQQLRAGGDALGPYGAPAGHPGLRAAIARHIGVARAVRATAEDVVVTSGIQQAIDLVGRVLLSPGDVVAVEDPCYPPPSALLRSLGAQVVGVPVDDEGLVVDAIPDAARLVYVTPSHQFPLGLAMSLRRRLALLAWAQEHDAAIVEDDYDSEFRFGGRPIEPLQSLDPAGRVLYAGSFSKTMLPMLRLGFVVVPPSLRRAVHAAKYVSDWYTAIPMQGALAAFIDKGWFVRHIRKMRAVYRVRHDLVVDTITRELDDHLELVPSLAGLHVSARAARLSAAETTEVVRRASASGVACYSLASFAVTCTPRAGVVLGYGSIPAADIPDGLRRLRECFDR